MKLSRYSLFAIVLLTIGTLLFYSCDKQENNDLVEDQKGIYKVVLSLSGDLVNFQPMVMINANYAPWEKDQRLFDATGKDIEQIGSYGYNYKDAPDAFKQDIICSTTAQAHGMATQILCGNPNVYSLSPSPKIKIDYKGYYNGQLVKTISKEIDALTSTTEGGQSYILIGRDMMGLPQKE